jgi:hypothetical protein
VIDLYEEEAERIYNVVQGVQQKYLGQEANGDNLLRLQQELVGRLADLGFGAIVDVTPTLEGYPVTVAIEERLDNEPFDAEKKRWQVKKRIEKGEDAPPIEGLV